MATARFTGVDILARKPDALVVVVDDIVADIGAQRFPACAVIGFTAVEGEYKCGILAGRNVLVWAGHSNRGQPLAVQIAAHAAKVKYVGGDCHFSGMTNAAAAAYAGEHGVIVPPPVPETAPEPEKPVEPPRPSATVVELRPRQQALPTPAVDQLPARYSHDSLAAAFTTANPDMRHVATWGKWLRWNGTYWAPDTTLAAWELARQTCRAAAEEARIEGTATPGAIRSIVSANTIAAVEKIARSDPAHAAVADQWDADPWLLNTTGGIVDLRDGSIRPGRPEDHQSRITRVAPSKDAPVAWLKFLAQATAGNAELIGFLQRMAGYALTGSVRDHALFFIYGTGGNGKGTFLNTLTWILGDYAHTASIEAFTETRSDQHPTSTAALMGRRLVSAQETEEGRRWAEAKLKSLTGGDPITARFMRQDEFTFDPQFKLVVVGNHKPSFRAVDDAIRRRLHLIPFTVKIDKPDTQLADKLRAEAGGILAWAIQGTRQWLEAGLQAPECVRAATEDYLTSQDTLETWIAECCDADKAFSGKVSVLFDSFRGWCERSGEFVIGRKRFVEALLSRGYDKQVYGGNYMIRGLRVRPAEDSRASSRYPD